MNEKLIFEIQAQLEEFDKSIDKVKAKVGTLGKNLEQTGKETEKVTKKMGKFGFEGSDAFKKIDQLTGGIATSIVDVFRGLEKSTKGAKGFAAAMAATGVGLVVAAVGILITYWDEINALIKNINTELEKQLELVEAKSDASSAEIKNLEAQKKLLEAQGESTEEVNEKLRTQLQAKLGLLGAELALRKATQDTKQEAAENTTIFEDLFNLTTALRGGPKLTGFVTKEERIELLKGNKAISETEEGIAKIQLAFEELFGPKKKNNDLDDDAIEKKTKLTRVRKEEIEGMHAFRKELAKTGKEFGVFNSQDIELAGEIAESDRQIKELEETIGLFRNQLGDVGELLSDSEILDAKKLGGDAIDQLARKFENFQAIAQGVGAGIGQVFGGIANSITQLLDTGNKFINSILGSIINTLAQIGARLLANLAIEKIVGLGKQQVSKGIATANAIQLATATAAASGPFGLFALPGLIAGAVATVQASFATIPAFARGGFSGDRNLVRMNGNELILNPMQQATLFNLLRGALPGGMSGGGVRPQQPIELVGKWNLKGSDIALSVERANKKSKRF